MELGASEHAAAVSGLPPNYLDDRRTRRATSMLSLQGINRRGGSPHPANRVKDASMLTQLFLSLVPRIFSLQMGPLFDPGFDARVG